MAGAIILVRHPPVARAWQRRCYGQSDPGLSRAGQAMVAALVDELAALRPGLVLHSDMRRTRAVAEPLARRLGLTAVPAPSWRERDFGSWEAQSWNTIYRATGNAMDGMVNAPASFRPGGTGETTRELASRISDALAVLPRRGTTVIVTHGGPIACARAAQLACGADQLPGLVPPTASITRL